MLALQNERWIAEKRDQWNCIEFNTLITDVDKSDHVLSMTDICKSAHYLFARKSKMIEQVFHKCNWDKLSSSQLLETATLSTLRESDWIWN
ncbi:hypothetical protein DKX38_005137 [Salix brachista]|uniref:Uncharacterized protein n=1 Tax=Salix brachista TaxID=2182728 RepID=A0A5N5NEJ2_9ROSI|nr:hypothetical protein DKX38_005137 [Salix brachista]